MPRVPFDPAIDYYQLLGVTPGAPSEEIQAAYRRLAKEFHPDLHSGEADAAARMARLNVAKSVLLDRDTRASYDLLRHERHSAGRTGVRPPPAPAPVRYPPYDVSQRPRYRVVSHAAGRAAQPAGFDRQTGILLLVALPLIAALVMYVLQAMQLSAQPLRAAPPDASIVPNNRPTSRGAANAVFVMVHAQPPNRELATRVNAFILARTDSTPESELLRADGRRLLRSATSGDTADWEAAIDDLCVLAGRC